MNTGRAKLIEIQVVRKNVEKMDLDEVLKTQLLVACEVAAVRIRAIYEYELSKNDGPIIKDNFWDKPFHNFGDE